MEPLRRLEVRIQQLEAQCRVPERHLRRVDRKEKDTVQKKDAVIDK